METQKGVGPKSNLFRNELFGPITESLAPLDEFPKSPTNLKSIFPRGDQSVIYHHATLYFVSRFRVEYSLTGLGICSFTLRSLQKEQYERVALFALYFKELRERLASVALFKIAT